MSAPIPHALTVTQAIEAWHALSEHGSGGVAARALGLTMSAYQYRVGAYRRHNGLHLRAKPWDPSGQLVIVCSRKDRRLAVYWLDVLLASMERADADGDALLATHIRRHLHRLEARLY